MFSIINRISVLPWRPMFIVLLAFILFIGGYLTGEKHVQAKWDAEKVVVAQVVEKQVAHLALVKTKQSIINQEISHEYQTNQAALAFNFPSFVNYLPERLQYGPLQSSSSLPRLPFTTTGVVSTTTDPLLNPEPRFPLAVCQQLARDAASTTLMVLGFQEWYLKQSGAFSKPINDASSETPKEEKK